MGICEKNTTLLKWSTATETNNDYFTIERSVDALNFEIIGNKDGAGNSQQILHYTFIDENLKEGTYYYRLKQTDFNGTFKYSKLIVVGCKSSFSQDILIYPNPSLEDITIELPGNNSSAKFEIISSQGQLIYAGIINTKILLSTEKYAPGVYLVKVESEFGTKVRKFIKN